MTNRIKRIRYAILSVFMRRIAFRPVILLASALLASAYSLPLQADTLRVAVASNFITPIKHLAADFEQETGHAIQLSFGSSGKLFAQIKHNAPYDVFLSADLEKPLTLIHNSLAVSDSLAIYAQGKLALWSRKPLPNTSIKDTLLNSQRIAIANPRLAPYGRAAEESLQHLSIWDEVKQKLVQGENIGQAYQFTYTQNAKVGFVALSQVLASPDSGYWKTIPNDYHDNINQAGVILSNAQNPVLAEAFMAFLMREDTQADIEQFGYSIEHN